MTTTSGGSRCVNCISSPMNTHRLPLELSNADELAQRRSLIILLVDDNLSARRFTRETLTSYGYGVIEAGSGSEGLEQFQKGQTRLSLIITAIAMREMSGVKMVEGILATAPSVHAIFKAGPDNSHLDDLDPRECTLLKKVHIGSPAQGCSSLSVWHSDSSARIGFFEPAGAAQGALRKRPPIVPQNPIFRSPVAALETL